MFADKLKVRVRRSVKTLQRFANRLWYPPFLGLLAALDNFIIIIPNDGILISSSMLTPRRWLLLALCVAAGSTVGAVLLSAAVEYQGLPWMTTIFPGVTETEYWALTAKFFAQHGLLVVFIVALTPLMQQPVVILASLSHIPLYELGLTMFAGRFIKYAIMTFVGSHAPRLLNKVWGISRELEDAGVEIK